MSIETVLKDLEQHMGERVETSDDGSYAIVKAAPELLLELLERLKEVHQFNYLANVTSVDYQDHFELVYHIYSIPDNRKIAVKADIRRDKAVAPSAYGIWPTADWQEREIYDLMGIVFEGHPNLKRVLLPQDFEGHPLRKDFQVKG